MSVDQSTQVYGIVGSRLAHTLSPEMHNAAFKVIGMNAVYKVFETKNLKDSLRNMVSAGIKGLSVTIPYKTEVIPLLDEIDKEALRLGSVNTIVNSSGRLIGFNTDAQGFLASLGPDGINSYKNALIIGAGGAARAVAFSLIDNGISVTITNRSEARGRALAMELGCYFLPLKDLRECKADLLVNTTPVGMWPDVDICPIPQQLLRKDMTVIDVIYNPLETRLLSIAGARGCRTIRGITMFVYQGVLQFRLWTGLNPPVQVMTETVKKCLMKKPLF